MNNNIASLASRAILVSLTINQWGADKQDANASAQVLVSNNASPHRGRFTKKLVSGQDARAVISAASALRRYHYHATFPWGENLRILPKANLLNYMQRMGELETVFNDAVEAFTNSLPALKEQAKMDLGMLYQEGDYPSPEDFKNCFNVQTSMIPLPAEGDWRLELSDSALEGLKGALEEQVQSTFKALHTDALNRIGETLQWLVTTMSKDVDEKRGRGFHGKYLTKLMEVCDNVGKLGISDPILLDVTAKTRELLSQPVEALRSNVTLRANAMQQASDMLATLSACLGE